ncbi:HSP18 transcriptional regulator, partial [Amycolatopsis sp. NPDC003861]
MDGTDPTGALRRIEEVVAAARAGVGDQDEVLAALSGLRLLREHLASWEPELITAARAAGASWVALAPALGVASRQAAERRYLSAGRRRRRRVCADRRAAPPCRGPSAPGTPA